MSLDRKKRKKEEKKNLRTRIVKKDRRHEQQFFLFGKKWGIKLKRRHLLTLHNITIINAKDGK